MTALKWTSWRIGVVSLLLLVAAPALAEDRREQKSPAGTVALGRGDGWSIGASETPHYGFLTREIARQAFLIAAREECGAATRDAWLGETLPASGDTKVATGETAPFDLVSSAGQSSLLELVRGFGAEQESIWRRELPSAGEFDYPKFIAQMEQMSRAEFVTVLEQQGFKRKAVSRPATPAATSFDELPPDTAKQLNEMSFTSQFAALRSLHRL